MTNIEGALLLVLGICIGAGADILTHKPPPKCPASPTISTICLPGACSIVPRQTISAMPNISYGSGGSVTLSCYGTRTITNWPTETLTGTRP